MAPEEGEGAIPRGEAEVAAGRRAMAGRRRAVGTPDGVAGADAAGERRSRLSRLSRLSRGGIAAGAAPAEEALAFGAERPREEEEATLRAASAARAPLGGDSALGWSSCVSIQRSGAVCGVCTVETNARRLQGGARATDAQPQLQPFS